MLFSFCRQRLLFADLVSITSRVTPVPIPNTTVKPLRADDTSGEALRESKSSPVEKS